MESESLNTLTRREALQRIGLITGGALSTSLVSGVLAGCRAAPTDPSYVPQTLDPNQYNLVGTLVDIIIPATDTPGAKDVGVPAFIDEMLTSWYLDEDAAAILTGLQVLDEQAQATFNAPFVDATEEQQHALVEDIAREAFPSSEPNDADAQGDLPPELPGLFREIKQLTVVGYYTSEIGASEELRVQPMGAYKGDIPYDEVGRAWS